MYKYVILMIRINSVYQDITFLLWRNTVVGTSMAMLLLIGAGVNLELLSCVRNTSLLSWNFFVTY